MTTILALLSDASVSHTQWRITRPFKELCRQEVEAHYIHSKHLDSSDGVIFQPEIVGLLDKDNFSVDTKWRHFVESLDILVLPRMIVYEKDREACLKWFEDLRRRGIFIVYETDDDIYSEAWSDHWFRCTNSSSIKEYRQLEAINNRWILDQVDGITVATPHLASVVSQYTTKPVVLLRNYIDVEAFEKGLVNRFDWEGRFTLGWAAGYRPESDAVSVSIAWSILARKYSYLQFVIAGHVPQVLAHCVPQDRLHIVPFKSMDEYPASMQVTIGCCAVSDTPFNKSRGFGKAMEFALSGAVVAGSKQLYEELIYNKSYGVISDSEEEWVNNLSMLIENSELRRDLAYNLKSLVKRDYDLKNTAYRWLKAYESLVALSTRAVHV